jgi:DUF4097 and DUF4098 domain-containing protein YvlB
MRTKVRLAQFITCIAVAGAVALPAAARTAAAQVYYAPQRVDTTLTLERNGTLRVSVYAGRISVTGASGTNVHVKGTVERGELEARARLGSVTLSMDENPSRSRADLDITVPTGTNVILEGFSTGFTVRGVKGEAKIESLSGSVVVSDPVGLVQVDAVSGSVEVSQAQGDVQAESVSGSVTVAGVDGNVEAESVSGRVSITEAKSKSVRAETVSGSITYSGTIEPTGNYVFKSHSGRLTLAVPDNAGATVSLQTYSGNVDSDFPVTLETGTTQVGHESRFEFRLGNGRARIVLETFNGNIRIQRGLTRANQE